MVSECISITVWSVARTWLRVGAIEGSVTRMAAGGVTAYRWIGRVVCVVIIPMGADGSQEHFPHVSIRWFRIYDVPARAVSIKMSNTGVYTYGLRPRFESRR